MKIALYSLFIALLMQTALLGAEKCALMLDDDVDPEEYSSPKSYFELALREIIEGNMDLEQVTEEE